MALVFSIICIIYACKGNVFTTKDLSIGQIADEIGYKNHSNFTAAFKRTYGYSPKKIRQKQHVLTINEPI